MNQKKIIILCLQLKVGRRKNFFLITNYLSDKFKDISVVSLSKSYRKKIKFKN